ncbi:MAG: CHASE3 domain-containing protein [Gemmatimonadales bacterium]
MSHTLEVQRELATVEARMSEAEAGQRGYLLTGHTSFLAPYTIAKQDVGARLANLRRLVSDNPAELRRLLSIESASRARLAELDSHISLARQGKREQAINTVTMTHSDSLMTEIRSGLQSMTNDEAANLRDLQQSLVRELRRGDMVSLGLAGALLVMLIALIVIARGAEHYRNLVTLCAWSRLVEYEGEWISFEDYLRRKFDISATHGISPDALSQLEVGLDEKKESNGVSPDDLLELELEEPKKAS